MKILVVDDCYMLQNLIENILHEFNYNDVYFADNPLEAEEKILVDSPDCILLDWHMPIMTGPELLKKLKSQESTKHIPVLMLTVEGSVESVKRAIDLGAEGYILKPINVPLLRTRLHDVERKLLLGLKGQKSI